MTVIDVTTWVQPMLNPRDCIHGSLARKCEICERDQEIHRLREAIHAHRVARRYNPRAAWVDARLWDATGEDT
jgi:hypothetical protein